MSEREVEDLLNLMPGYAAILERDDYQALRSPAFARGYVRSYGRLLHMDLDCLLQVFDQLRADSGVEVKRVERRAPPQLQHTGVGIVIGLLVLLLLVFALWWWHQRGGAAGAGVSAAGRFNTVIAGADMPAGEQ